MVRWRGKDAWRPEGRDSLNNLGTSARRGDFERIRTNTTNTYKKKNCITINTT